MTDNWFIPALLLAFLFAAAIIVHARSVDRRRAKDRTVTRLDDGSVQLSSAVPDALQLVFGGYAGRDGKVTGLICLQKGISVSYEDGSSYTFYAVPEGGALVWDKGEIKVARGDVEA